MFFLSLEYLLLVSIVFAVYWSLPWRRVRLGLLLAASYLFYMSWSPKLVVLLLFSTGLDFTCGAQIAQATGPARRRWLVLSLVGNLGVLAVFKYYGFFVDSMVDLLHLAGIAAQERTLEIVLPLGISFYTFQTLSYTIDIYRGELRPTTSLLEFALFVAFFPQLVAGPIVRARDFLPQVTSRRPWNADDVHAGLERILLGVVKKGVIADNLGRFVDTVYADPSAYGPEGVWLAFLAFYGQIYGDFSGYSDIAVGSARLFGFRLPENFRQPWLAASPREFWRRWHITLSTWLRDYLYISLGGNRRGMRRLYVNLMITMVLGGLWHGAAWPYVVWGGFHGALLVVDRMRVGGEPSGLRRIPATLFMLVLTLVGWSLFRAPDMATFFALWERALFAPGGLLPRTFVMIPVLLAVLVLAESAGARVWRHLEAHGPAAWTWRPAVWVVGVMLVMFGAPASVQTFIYFVF